MPLYQEISAKKAVTNPQNIDQCCFKLFILVNCASARINLMRSASTIFQDCRSPHPSMKLDRRNPDVSVNVYGLEHDDTMKWLVYMLRKVDREQQNHFDLLYIDGSENTLYAYVSSFLRLVRWQKTKHRERIFTCKSCFSSFNFDRRSSRFTVVSSGQSRSK